MFLDDLVDQLKSIFESEDLIGELHCLLHADDALVLTTDRDTFIRKHNMQLWIIFVKTCRHCTCLNLATLLSTKWVLINQTLLVQKYHWHSESIKLHPSRCVCGVMITTRVSWLKGWGFESCFCYTFFLYELHPGFSMNINYQTQ